MKTFLTILTIIIFFPVFGQNWKDSVAKKFYTRIDPLRKLDCCDKNSNCISVRYHFPTYEMPYNSGTESVENYFTNVIDSMEIEDIVSNLVKTYNKIPSKLRNNFTKSCYIVETEMKITENLTGSGLVFTEGEIHFFFGFQMDKPYNRPAWKKLFGLW